VLPPDLELKAVLDRIQVRLIAFQKPLRMFGLHCNNSFYYLKGEHRHCLYKPRHIFRVLTDSSLVVFIDSVRIKMAQPTFFLQPLAAAISLACFSSVVFAAEADSAHILAPIVVTAQQGNDAHGLIVHADPKQPIQPIPAVDGAAYLQSIVGFNQIKNGGTNGDVTFRGMFGSRIKILTDGTENLGACPSRMDNPLLMFLLKAMTKSRS
jgi:hypothetical protein